MKLLQLLVYIVLIMIILIFAALNAAPITMQLYWKTVQLPLAWVMACCMVFGMLICSIVFVLKYVHLLLRLQKMKHQLGILEKEIKNLRTIPIQDSH